MILGLSHELIITKLSEAAGVKSRIESIPGKALESSGESIHYTVRLLESLVEYSIIILE